MSRVAFIIQKYIRTHDKTISNEYKLGMLCSPQRAMLTSKSCQTDAHPTLTVSSS